MYHHPHNNDTEVNFFQNSSMSFMEKVEGWRIDLSIIWYAILAKHHPNAGRKELCPIQDRHVTIKYENGMTKIFPCHLSIIKSTESGHCQRYKNYKLKLLTIQPSFLVTTRFRVCPQECVLPWKCWVRIKKLQYIWEFRGNTIINNVAIKIEISTYEQVTARVAIDSKNVANSVKNGSTLRLFLVGGWGNRSPKGEHGNYMLQWRLLCVQMKKKHYVVKF